MAGEREHCKTIVSLQPAPFGRASLGGPLSLASSTFTPGEPRALSPVRAVGKGPGSARIVLYLMPSGPRPMPAFLHSSEPPSPSANISHAPHILGSSEKHLLKVGQSLARGMCDHRQGTAPL